MGSNALIDAITARDAPLAIKLVRDAPELARRTDENNLSPLMLALYYGLEDAARAIEPLVQPLDVFEAAAIGDVERLEALLVDGAAANAWSPDGFTPLHLAGFFGRPTAVRRLIDRGANLETPSRNQHVAGEARPLHSAVAAGHLEVCRILLDAGADPNARQHGGYTPLLEAAQSANAALIELLLEFGADRNATLDDGRSMRELLPR